MNFEGPRNAETVAAKQTSEPLRTAAGKAIELFTKNFTIEGADHLQEIRDMRREHLEDRFVIAAAHLSNLDGPAAIKALGEDFDLQMAVASNLFGSTPQELMFRAAGKENFTGLTYEKKEGKSQSVFDPADFDQLIQKSGEGKTPWIAAHPFTTSGAMERVRVGPLYLAQKTGTYVLPTALELRGEGDVSLEGIANLARAAVRKSDAIYHIGAPYKPEAFDVSIIEKVLREREERKKVSTGDAALFKTTLVALREQADALGRKIAELLPEAMRGVYGESEKT